jgi:deazaflavin-dependent oxidoreductase (nitroreductase family)
MTDKVEIGAVGWQDTHRDLYLKTNGAEGHLVDFTRAGGSRETPCLILKTVGRRSGEPKLVPLIYGRDGERFVVVASKGGAPKHPAWFLNLVATPDVGFQVIDKKYRGVARVTKGAERERLFAMMAGVYPPYTAYQARTEREIPVVALEARGETEQL